MTSLRTRILAVVTALAAVTCVAAPAQASSGSHHVPTLRRTASGLHVILHEGHRLRLDLETDSDAGLSWQFIRRPEKSVVRLVKKTMKPYPHKKHYVGFAYHTYYLFKASGAGTTKIKLVERQPFNHKDVAAHFRLTISVKA